MCPTHQRFIQFVCGVQLSDMATGWKTFIKAAINDIR